MCYDRAPGHRLALTFVLSALWHGVFPGYYFTFITAIPITMAARAVGRLDLEAPPGLAEPDRLTVSSVSARQIRKSFRHHFLRSRGLKLGYDVLTWASTQLTICYTVMPFLLLSVGPTFIYYRCVNSFYTSVIYLNS